MPHERRHAREPSKDEQQYIILVKDVRASISPCHERHADHNDRYRVRADGKSSRT